MWLAIRCLCVSPHMGCVILIISLTRLLGMNGRSWVRVVRLMGYWLAIIWLIMLWVIWVVGGWVCGGVRIVGFIVWVFRQRCHMCKQML